jgi:hypothetical protein
MTRSLPLAREAALSAAAAGTVAAILLWLGPPGADFAAHAYQRTLFLQHGFVLWNNFWYAGRYSFVTYSLLYYPLAAVLGIKVLAVASVVAAAAAFALVLGREWGPVSRLSSRTFAVIWAGIVLSAAFPFALGAALALFSLLALQSGRRWRFAVLAVLTLASSPLAFMLLAVVLIGIGLGRRGGSRIAVPAAVMGAAALVELVLLRLFPGAGRYPFGTIDLIPALIFCVYGAALVRREERARQLLWIFIVYLAACLAAFAIPSEVGGNIERLRYAALPIALLVASLRGWRPLRFVLPAVVLAVSWNLTPLAFNFAQAASDPAAAQTYWGPAIGYLKGHLTPSYRVEAVDTAGHWAAVYLPDAGIPLVRGWYRQNDFPENAILYGRFGSAAYLGWLRRMGVRYVVLTDAPTDYSATAEAALLRGGRSGLRLVYSGQHSKIYTVPAARPILTGPARSYVDWLGETEAWLSVAAPGTYRLALRYSPYWQAEQACVEPARDGMIRLTVLRGGFVDLDLKLGVGRLFQTLVGTASQRRCS